VSQHFSFPRPNVIESDSGYRVEILGRNWLRYTEGDRTMVIDSEILDSVAGMSLWQSSIERWEPPNNSVLIDDGERRRIVENIRAAFEAKGYELDVI
jgi:hypothetical protein